MTDRHIHLYYWIRIFGKSLHCVPIFFIHNRVLWGEKWLIFGLRAIWGRQISSMGLRFVSC